MSPNNPAEIHPPEAARARSVEGVFSIAARVVALMLCLGYAVLFWRSLQPYWFHPGWTTDDALQQIYPFYDLIYPGIFEGDLVTEVMRGYLPPIHYWLGAAITWLTESPIMAGHWLHLLQLLLSLLFLFLLVRRAAGVIPALFAVTWLLHTRYVMQRLTAGLPRGWALVVLLAFLYFAIAKRHRMVLAVLLCGCLLHPPSTLVAATSYGLMLLVEAARARKITRPLIELAVISPICVVVTALVVSRPDYIGPMVSYSEAMTMPEFSRPRGRFPFVPLNPVVQELDTFAFQVFGGRLYSPGWWLRGNDELGLGRFLRESIPWVGVSLVVLVPILSLVRRKRLVPVECWYYLVGVVTVYAASRLLAFKLYVPDRHIQFPLAVFFIVTLTIAAWRVAERRQPMSGGEKSVTWRQLLSLIALGAIVVVLSGSGLQGTANFNYASTKKGRAFAWLQKFTPPSAYVAGDPTHIDSTQLFAVRRAFITTETAHPFYPVYNREVRRRLEISLRAHYAATEAEFLSLIEPEGISHFVFKRQAFYPEELATATYFLPFEELMAQVRARAVGDFVFRDLVKLEVGGDSPVVFKDEQSLVVDIQRLKARAVPQDGPLEIHQKEVKP